MRKAKEVVSWNFELKKGSSHSQNMSILTFGYTILLRDMRIGFFFGKKPFSIKNEERASTAIALILY